MKLATCNVMVNAYGEELNQHGTTLFPISHYEGNLMIRDVPWHWHEDFEFIWITKGTAKVFINNTEHTLQPNEGIFINAGILHAVSPAAELTSICRSIVFHPRLIGSIDSIFWQKYTEPIIQNKKLPYIYFYPTSDWHKKIIELTKSVWQNLSEEHDWFESGIRHELTKIIILILANYHGCEVIPNMKKMLNATRIKTMLQYIHTNFSGKIVIADLANEALISTSEVLRCFHNTLHTTPNQYIKHYRLEKAIKLLQNTNLPTTTIALDCGFQSSSYFTKAFREKIGCTPQNFRKSYHCKTT